MTSERHNGWANRETWLVNLWLSNEEHAYFSCREIAAEAGEGLKGREAAIAAGDAIRDRWCDPLRESAGMSEGFLCDMLAQSFNRVDWREIGVAFLA